MSTYYERRPPSSPLAACVALLTLLCLLVFGGGLVWWFWPWGRTGLDPNAQPRPVAARGDLAPLEQANIEIYEQASPAVVHVTNLVEQQDLFSLDIQEVPKGSGSGFVWDEDGHIVTNFHVVSGANAAQVTLADHSSFAARRVSGYPDLDIAVLWIQAPKGKLRPIQVGTSHDLKVGQLTYAIGNPFGLDQTLTTGIVSALGRQIRAENGRQIRGVIQTSAPINPGNSGGPLLDSAGRLIGMNAAIVSPSGAFAGIGFAIPVDEINRVVPQLIAHGKIVRPRLGVQIAEDQIAQRLGVDQGVLIIKVQPDSPAAKAGLDGTRRDESGRIHLGDVIVAIDGKAVNNANDLHDALDQYKDGDTVTVTVTRNGKRQDFKVTLQVIE
jgi:S1-C subfamily serine protease